MWAQIKTFFAMGEYCAKEGVAYAPCQDYFWLAGSYAAIAGIALGMLVFAFRQWRLYAMRRASKRLTLEYLEAQQRVADEVTMQSMKWKGDNIAVPEADQAHITAEIRNALRARKING